MRHPRGFPSRITMKPTAHRWHLSFLAAMLVVAFVLSLPVAQAEPVAFGERTLEVPAPQGFEPVAQDIPAYIRISEGYLPPTNRLVEAYLSRADKAALMAGERRDLQRYFQLQTLRSIDGKPVSAADFGGALGAMEAQIEALVPKMAREGAKLVEQGNKTLNETTGSQAEVSMGGPTYHGIFRREPWGLFFTASMPISLSEGGTTVTARMVGATALVLVDQQLMYLYAFADESEPGAREWAERSLSAWADAVRAGNPARPAPAGSR
jgi:hypothetical protein